MEDAEKRMELSTSGHTHLGCYADQSMTFDLWLTPTEEKLASLSSGLPGSREGVGVVCDQLHQLVEEVERKGSDMDTLETSGACFLASAKVCLPPSSVNFFFALSF